MTESSINDVAPPDPLTVLALQEAENSLDS